MKGESLIKRFIPYYKPFRKVFIFDLFCALVYAGAGILFPVLVRNLLNNYVSTEYIMWSKIGATCALMVGLKILEVSANYFMLTAGHVMGAKLEADMRRDLFDKLLNLDHSFYDNNKVGDLMSRVNNDLFQITEFSHHFPEEMIIAGAKLIGIFIYLLTVHVPLTLILFACLPFMAFVAVYFNKRLRRVFRKQREQVSIINSHLEDSLAGMTVVKSFAREDMELDRFQEDNRAFVRIKRRSYKYMGGFHTLIKLLTGLFYIITAVVGSVFISIGEIDTVDLLTYLLYVNSLMMTIEVIMTYTEQFQQAMSGFSRFAEVIEAPITVTDKADAFEADKVDFKSDIVFDDVTFKYEEKGRTVLNNINFSVKSGEKVALVGPSGAGKTTIANLITRFYDISSGRILIGGKDIKSVKLRSLRENIGVVQQNVYLFEGTIRKNILYGRPDADEEEIIAAAKNAGAHEFIIKLPEGYDTNCGERGAKLSGGQKQRIAIARVFLKNPSILILDEATSSLDNESEKIVQRSLDDLSKGRTTLTIAHRLSTIKNADRILVVTENGIEEQGTHEELLSKGGVYSALYQTYES